MRSFRRSRSSPADPWATAGSAPARVAVLLGSPVPPVGDDDLALVLAQDVASLPDPGAGWWALASALERDRALRLCREQVLPAPLSVRLRRVHSWSLEEVGSFRAGTAAPLFGPFGGFDTTALAGLWERCGGTPANLLLFQSLVPSPVLSLEGGMRLVAGALGGVPPPLLPSLSWVLVPAAASPEEAARLLSMLGALPEDVSSLLLRVYVPSVGVLPPALADCVELVHLLSMVAPARRPELVRLVSSHRGHLGLLVREVRALAGAPLG